ncbi:MAG: alpha-hydroxy acid oxidase [Acidimicrobiales bacterium]
MASVAEYGRRARERLPLAIWDYIAGGAGDELTVAANQDALLRLRLRPRVLVDVARRDMGTALLGRRVRAPVAVAPMAYHRLAHPEGETATARAAGAEGLAVAVSTFASCTIEDIAAAATGPVWFQVYCFRDRAITADLVRRAEEAGCEAMVLTVDMPVMARRARDARNRFALPATVTAANLPVMTGHPRATSGGTTIAELSRQLVDPSLTWDVLDWMRDVTRLPIVLKGILTSEDAALAVSGGADGVLVSNHGGRQLDGAVAAVDALAPIVDEVAGACEVYVDGGMRRGVDVLKALALGARAVLVGRPVLWGLAVDGAAGARAVLQLLADELDEAMALCGCQDLAAIGRQLLQR